MVTCQGSLSFARPAATVQPWEHYPAIHPPGRPPLVPVPLQTTRVPNFRFVVLTDGPQAGVGPPHEPQTGVLGIFVRLNLSSRRYHLLPTLAFQCPSVPCPCCPSMPFSAPSRVAPSVFKPSFTALQCSGLAINALPLPLSSLCPSVPSCLRPLLCPASPVLTSH